MERTLFALLHPMVIVGGRPHFSMRNWSGAAQVEYAGYAPVELAETAAYLRANGVEVRIHDGQAGRTPVSRFVSEVAADKPDWAVLALGWQSIESDLALLRDLKRASPTTKIIAGGAPATARPGVALAEPAVDFVALGELDDPCLRLVRGDHSRNLAWRGAHGAIECAPREAIPDLDLLPTPAWDLLPIKCYVIPSAPCAPSLTYRLTRQCSYGACTFCPSAIYRAGPQKPRSAARALDDLETIVRHGVRHVIFTDQMLTGDKELVLELCRGMRARGLGLKWQAASRADCLDAEIVREMAASGCALLALGIESSCADTLRKHGKRSDHDTVANAVRLAQAAGIGVIGHFILGLEGETESVVARMADYAIGLGLDYAEFTVAMILPGTPWYDARFPAGGRALAESFVWNDETVPLDRLRELQRQAYRRFYFRPRVLWRQVTRVRSASHFRVLARTAFALLKTNPYGN
jgi:radical SAM superfamily enzyme YgiQ (UPF0313 family)